MSDKVTRSRITDQIAPVYPRAALQKQLEGTVVIEATIDEHVRVREPYVSARQVATRYVRHELVELPVGAH